MPIEAVSGITRGGDLKRLSRFGLNLYPQQPLLQVLGRPLRDAIQRFVQILQ